MAGRPLQVRCKDRVHVTPMMAVRCTNGSARNPHTAWCADVGLQRLSADLGLLDLCLDKRTESVSDVTMVERCGLTALVRPPNADQLGLDRTYAIWPAGAARSSACPVARLERGGRVPARGRRRHRQRLAACPTRGCPRAAPALPTEQPQYCGISNSGTLMAAPMSDEIACRLTEQACLLASIDPRRLSSPSLRRSLPTTVRTLQFPPIDPIRKSRHRSADITGSQLAASAAWPRDITEPAFREGGPGA